MSEPSLVDRTLSAGLAASPDRVAVRSADGAVALGYGQLDAAARSVGDGLRTAGVGPGEAVAVVCDNSVEFVAGLLGISAAGAVAVPLDPTMTAPQLAQRSVDAYVRAAVVASGGAAPGLGAVPAFELTVGADGTAHLSTGAPLVAGAPLPQGTELVMFTSGTTGRAKAVPQTADNVHASVNGVITSLALDERDSTVAVMPLHHGHGLVCALLASLTAGGAVTMPSKGRFSASTFWPDMAGAAATWYTAVPTIHQILLSRAADDFPGRTALHLRFARTCSAPIADAVVEEFETTFGIPLISAYGMTETAHQAASNPVGEPAPRRSRSVGVGTSVDVRIDIGAVTGEPEGHGEILVRGPGLMSGYLNAPDANATTFVDGWFRTGDIGRLDTDGYLYVTGRIKELINRGGEKIAPEAVEDVLLQHPSVLEAAVYGVPDDVLGERVEAAVSLEPGATTTVDELTRFAAKGLSRTQVPSAIRILPELPHTSKGAPDRKALAAEAEARPGHGGE